jgi:hypothetical protein
MVNALTEIASNAAKDTFAGYLLKVSINSQTSAPEITRVARWASGIDL